MSPVSIVLCAWVLWGQLPTSSAFETHSAYPTHKACVAARAALAPQIRRQRGASGTLHVDANAGYRRLVCLPDTVRPQ